MSDEQDYAIPEGVAGSGAGLHSHLDAPGALLAGESHDLEGGCERLGPRCEERLARKAVS